jgi:hypothetical protein
VQAKFALDKVLTVKDVHGKVPILTCSHNIRICETIGCTDVTTGEIEVAQVPANSAGDVWLALGRHAILPLGRGDQIDYGEVIPRWKQIFFEFPEDK